ncbi:MAG: toxin-antitoxin system, antitoxin component, Xre family protein [Ruminococcus sp.]|nr:toxin-antitoxin system, antitoxin component, Xre family protein [Ruminococcus sp.]
MNLELLKDKIEEINIPITTIANKMGISRQSLNLKLKGSRRFKMSEANSISEILRLTNRERTSIFFGAEDDKNVN